MTIGLYGIRGVYNFGCEAIVRGAYNFINEIYPGSEIIYFSYSPVYDRERLTDLDISIVPVTSATSKVKRAINKSLRMVHSNIRFLMIDYREIVDKVDVLMSIGGDIYTIPRVLRESEKYPFYNPIVELCKKAVKKGKHVIVYGASVGPWGRYEPAVRYYSNALKKYNAILCREEETVKYLGSLGFKNARFFPDPAFQVRSYKGLIERKYIGFNFSPLSFYEVYGAYKSDHIKVVASLLDEVYDRFGYDLMMLPHVIAKSENDNDLLFLNQIRDMMKNKNRVQFGKYEDGFLGIKESIRKCKVVVAARMHCAVNAVDENIPTIFVSYSQKSIGMSEYVYGNKQMLIDLTRIDTELIPLLEKALKNCGEIGHFLEDRNKEIEQYYMENMDEMKNMLKTKRS